MPVAPANPHLVLLGSFRLSCGGRSYEVGATGQRLLAYIAVRWGRQPASRSALCGHLWPDVDRGAGAASLRSALWRLPRPGGHRLVDAAAGPELTLAPALVVDLWQVTEAVGRGGPTQDAIESSLSAPGTSGLRHDLLPEWDEPWLVGERETYRQARLHRLEQLAEQWREAGNFAASLGAAFTAIEGDPLRESAHRCVVATHLAESNVSEALRHFDRYATLLASELDLRPSPVMQAQVAPYLRGSYHRPGSSGRDDERLGRAAGTG